jgi:phosphate transport system substrate-binding protein
MKKYIYLSILLPALFLGTFAGKKTTSPEAAPLAGSITISGAFALYPMAVTWAEEFKKSNPNVKIDISAGGAGKGMTDVLSGVADIGMVSRDINPEEIKRGAFSLAVTKDAVVPTVSGTNPNITDILKKGMKRQAFVDLWVTGKIKTWGQAAGLKSNGPVHVYTRSDASGAGETWAKYLGKKQEDLLGVGVFGDPGLAMAIKKDPVGIGFNNIAYVYDSKTKQQTNGVRVIPIDINNNGTVDTDENFYNTIEQFIAAVANGKYPSPPARDLYFVTKGKPSNALVTAFIKYVLTDGQKFVRDAGYINLSNDKLQSELNKLK